MRKRPVMTAAALLACAALARPARAGSLTLAFAEHAVENLFQTRDARADRISDFDLDWSRDFGAFSLLSSATYSYFSRTPALSGGTLAAGGDYLRALSGTSALYLGAEARGGLYREEYRDFDFLSLGFLAAYKAYLGSPSIFKAEARTEYRTYRDPLFDHLRQTLGVSLDRFLPSRTTLKAAAGWGTKIFFHPFQEAAPAGADPPSGNGRRRGPGHGGIVPRTLSGGRGATIQIASVSGWLAQGLGERIGISLSAVRQWTLAGENPFLSIEEYYFFENPSYDDFSWAGWAWQAGVTLHLPWDSELKIGYNESDKTFGGIEAMTETGVLSGAARSDLRREIQVRLAKDFPRFSVFLTYGHIRNRSNDPNFSWRGRAVQGGIEWRPHFGRND